MNLLKIMALSILFTGIISKSYADSNFYVGTEYLHESIKENLTDDIEVSTLSDDMVFANRYESSEILPNSYNSVGIYLGYEFYPNFFIEAGYAKSRQKQGYFNDLGTGLLNGISEAKLKHYRIALLTKYTFPKYNKMSLIGSLGVMSRKAVYDVEYETGGGCIPDASCNPNVTKKDSDSRTRYRVQYGIGFQYDIDKNISTRLMVKSILNSSSDKSGLPYSVSLGAHYNF